MPDDDVNIRIGKIEVDSRDPDRFITGVVDAFAKAAANTMSDRIDKKVAEVDAAIAARPEFLIQFFGYEHLPPAMQEISRPFGELAALIVATVPRNQERTVALRKLLEAKDCAVRAAIAKG